jgi:hypothetical protein
VQARRALPCAALPWGCILCLAVLACNGEKQGPPAGQKQIAAQSDSLVLATSGGAEVWFTLARPATGKNGRQCVERGLEIRSHGKRTRVPLLYTGAAPVLLNDTTMRAMLWKDCTPDVPYLVNLRTGQPVPERGANTL